MTPVPGDLKYPLYLTFTQEEKESLIAQGWGGETGSKVLTIYESQGLTSATVIVVNTKSIRLQLHDSVSHAVVAISRHTDTCTYYSEGKDDAVKMLIRNATGATTKHIVEYHLKMALKDRNAAVASSTIAVMPLS